jgi:hypothetical protein
MKIVSALSAEKLEEILNARTRINSPLQVYRRANASRLSLLTEEQEAANEARAKQGTQFPSHLPSHPPHPPLPRSARRSI